MKIKRVYIDNYRFFSSFELKFETNKQNCSTGIYGHNGTGKTTVLKLIKILASTVHQYFNFLNNSGVDDKQKKFVLLFSLDEAYHRIQSKFGNINLEVEFENTKETAVKLAFRDGKILVNGAPLNHYLEKDSKSRLPGILAQFTNFYFYPSIAQLHSELLSQPSASNKKESSNPQVESFVDKLLPFLSAQGAIIEDWTNFTTLTSKELVPLSQQYKDSINNKSKQYNEFKAFLDNILEDKKLASVKDDVVWFSMERRGGSEELIRLQDLSAGEFHLITRIIKLYTSQCSNGLLMFDEPETSFHFEWQKKLLDIIHGVPGCTNNQIIFASHSEHLAQLCDQFIFLSYDSKECRVRVFDDSVAGPTSSQFVKETNA